MLTLFGKVCRKLRIDSGELLKDMAGKLGVTSSYLSAVENGKRNIPSDWPEAISKLYDLNDEEKIELVEAARESQQVIKLDLSEYESSEKKLVLAFARKVKDLTAEEKRKIGKMFLNQTVVEGSDMPLEEYVSEQKKVYVIGDFEGVSAVVFKEREAIAAFTKQGDGSWLQVWIDNRIECADPIYEKINRKTIKSIKITGA